jgi:nucleotide-binding universal stress UspA family protein
MNILVPFDFSKASEKALDLAVKHINDYTGKINLLHVVNDETQLPESSMDIEALEEQEMEAIEKFAQQYCEKNKMDRSTISVEILYGIASHLINDEAKKYDLVIMGTHNKTEWFFRFLGSVSEATIAHSKVPVILVPESWDNTKPVGKVLFAIDELTHINGALEKFIVYNSRLKAHVDFIHYEDHAENSTHNADEVKQLLANHPEAFTFDIKNIVTAHPLEALGESLKSGAYNLLVMVKREKGILQTVFGSSFTNKSIHLGYTPVLIYREE